MGSRRSRTSRDGGRAGRRRGGWVKRGVIWGLGVNMGEEGKEGRCSVSRVRVVGQGLCVGRGVAGASASAGAGAAAVASGSWGVGS